MERGCPPEHTIPSFSNIQSTDRLTRRIEEQVRTSAERYEFVERCSKVGPNEGWMLVRDTQATTKPIRLFLEAPNPNQHGYTLREGAFAHEAAARDWLTTRNRPLPDPSVQRDSTEARRAGAARSRSTAAPVDPMTAPPNDGPRAVPASPAPLRKTR